LVVPLIQHPEIAKSLKFELPVSGSLRFNPLFLDSIERDAWLIFFIGSTLTAFGSAYYHWRPNNSRLVRHDVACFLILQ
jgi:hypothetical protein